MRVTTLSAQYLYYKYCFITILHKHKVVIQIQFNLVVLAILK